MFPSLICSSLGGTVYTPIGIFCAYYFIWLLAGMEQKCNQPADIIHTKYTNCFIYSDSWWWANKCSKHVESINCNKLIAFSAPCWSYCTDILWCMVNRTLRYYYHIRKHKNGSAGKDWTFMFMSLGVSEIWYGCYGWTEQHMTSDKIVG
jgi:hypothetical protein